MRTKDVDHMWAPRMRHVLSDDLISIQKQKHHIIGGVSDSKRNVHGGDLTGNQTDMVTVTIYARVGRDAFAPESPLSHTVRLQILAETTKHMLVN